MPRQAKTARIRRARPADPYVRLRLDEHEDLADVLVDGDHVAWAQLGGKSDTECWGTALGSDPNRLVTLLRGLHTRQGLDGITVPEDVFGHLPLGLRSRDAGHWCLWEWVPGTSIEHGEATWLSADDPRIATLLRHSASAHVFPGDHPMARWAGVVESGALLSVAGCLPGPNGYAHVVSVCTDPLARGRRLAQRCIALLIARSREQGDRGVTLEMYVANDAGRRAYQRMGFVEVGRYASGLLDRSLPIRAARLA